MSEVVPKDEPTSSAVAFLEVTRDSCKPMYTTAVTEAARRTKSTTIVIFILMALSCFFARGSLMVSISSIGLGVTGVSVVVETTTCSNILLPSIFASNHAILLSYTQLARLVHSITFTA